MLTAKSALRKDRQAGTATMEHRHFATIAKILRDLPMMPDGLNREEITHRFADALADTNPRFDRDRFLRAANPEISQ